MTCSLYSKTSNNGPSEKWTTSLQRTAHLPLIDFTIELIHYEPPRSGQPLYKGQMARPQSVLCLEVLLYPTFDVCEDLMSLPSSEETSGEVTISSEVRN